MTNAIDQFQWANGFALTKIGERDPYQLKGASSRERPVRPDSLYYIYMSSYGSARKDKTHMYVYVLSKNIIKNVLYSVIARSLCWYLCAFMYFLKFIQLHIE
jgi:hypothetical protein